MLRSQDEQRVRIARAHRKLADASIESGKLPAAIVGEHQQLHIGDLASSRKTRAFGVRQVSEIHINGPEIMARALTISFDARQNAETQRLT